MKTIDVSMVDWDSVFLHYTNIQNIQNIKKHGLMPAIGPNSKGIEKTKKIFFTIGYRGAIVIMDVWLKWLILTPRNRTLYRIGAYLMPIGVIPDFIYSIFYKIYSKSKFKKYSAYKEMKKIINNSVWLVLDIKEGKDFSYNDIDEVKSRNFPKKFLKLFYNYRSDIYDIKTEYWNMHLFSNKSVNPENISILTYNNKTSVYDIIKFLEKNHPDFIRKNCHLLSNFLKTIN